MMNNSCKLIWCLSFFFLLAALPDIVAQTITHSNFELDEKGYDFSKVLGEDDAGFFVLQSNLSFEYSYEKVGFKYRKYRLLYFDYDLRPLWKQELMPNRKDQTIDKVFYAAGRVCMAMLSKTANDNHEYYFQWINNKGSASNGNIKAFAYQVPKNSEFELLTATTSENKEQTVLLFSEITAEKKQVFYFYRIDTLSAVLSVNKLRMDEKPDEFIAEEFDISNHGEIAFSGIYRLPGQKKNAKALFTNRLFLLKPGADDAVSYDFELPDKTMSDASIVFDNKNNKLIMAGIYFDKASVSGSGVAYGVYDPVLFSTASIYFNPLNDTNTKIKGERNNVLGAGLSNFNVNRLVARSDGGVVLIGESITVSETSYYDYFTQSFNKRVSYNYGNMLVVSINTDGSIHWSNIIRKEQESVDDGGIYSSYGTLNLTDKLMFFYNRNIYQNTETIKVTIDQKGQHEEKDLVRNSNHMIMMPRYGRQVSAEEFIMPSMQRKRIVLTKISFL